MGSHMLDMATTGPKVERRAIHPHPQVGTTVGVVVTDFFSSHQA